MARANDDPPVLRLRGVFTVSGPGDARAAAAWNLLMPEVVEPVAGGGAQHPRRGVADVGGRRAARCAPSSGTAPVPRVGLPTTRAMAPNSWSLYADRRRCGAADEDSRGEFDRVLGGGLVAGLAMLIGGEPGLASQPCSCNAFSGSPGGRPHERVSSPARSRRNRSGAARSGSAQRVEGVRACSPTPISTSLGSAVESASTCVVVDSIQTSERPVPRFECRDGDPGEGVRTALVQLAASNRHGDPARRARHQGRSALAGPARSSTSSKAPFSPSKVSGTTRPPAVGGEAPVRGN